MTTEEGDTVLNASEAMVDRIRVIRSVRQDASGQTYVGVAVLRERLRIGEALPPIGEAYLRRHISEMGPDRILSFSENAELNAAADRIFSQLRGRMDDRHALREIGKLINSARLLERAHFSL